MGRIITRVAIENASDSSKRIETDALVDTGAYMMILPNAWRDRLGNLPASRKVEVHLATEEMVEGEVCGPVYIQIPGFNRIASEVLFLQMKPVNGDYEPLVGYITLEQSQAAVDMVGHRLTHIRHVDVK
jgi:predicted aspartyl protease